MRHNSHQRGFTIVELLIVITVIALLAAIVIIAYSGVQKRARDAAVRSDFSNVQKRIELIKVESSDNTYPPTLHGRSGFRINKSLYITGANWNIFYCPNEAHTSYAFGAMTQDTSILMDSSGEISKTSNYLTAASVCAEAGRSDGSPATFGYNGSAQQWANWTSGDPE